MRRLMFVCILLVALAGKSFAQEASVEKSMYGVQMGINPLAVYNELKLTNSIALRSELGFGFAWYSGSSSDSYWAAIPELCVEPRMYYNLNKRQEKGKRIDGNSGNYVSIRVGYQPGLAVSSDNSEFYPSVSILPMWGIKRNIGKSFNYEVGMGIGYYWAFKEYTPFYSNEMTNYTERGLAFGLRLGIGYKF